MRKPLEQSSKGFLILIQGIIIAAKISTPAANNLQTGSH